MTGESAFYGVAPTKLRLVASLAVLIAGLACDPGKTAGEACYGDDCRSGLLCSTDRTTIGCEDLLPKLCRQPCSPGDGACGNHCACVQGCADYVCASPDGGGNCP